MAATIQKLKEQIEAGETAVADKREERADLRGQLNKVEKELDILLLKQDALVSILLGQVATA